MSWTSSRSPLKTSLCRPGEYAAPPEQVSFLLANSPAVERHAAGGFGRDAASGGRAASAPAAIQQAGGSPPCTPSDISGWRDDALDPLAGGRGGNCRGEDRPARAADFRFNDVRWVPIDGARAATGTLHIAGAASELARGATRMGVPKERGPVGGMLRVRLRGFEHQITGSRGAPVAEFGRLTMRMRRWRENLAD
jgi:hypothetical protein